MQFSLAGVSLFANSAACSKWTVIPHTRIGTTARKLSP